MLAALATQLNERTARRAADTFREVISVYSFSYSGAGCALPWNLARMIPALRAFLKTSPHFAIFVSTGTGKLNFSLLKRPDPLAQRVNALPSAGHGDMR